MGPAVPLTIILVLVTVVLLVAVGMGLLPLAKREKAKAEEASSGEVDSLRYRVTEGQDPVAVMTALRTAGYDAVADPSRPDGRVILVVCPDGAASAREDVRRVIEQDASLNLEGDPAHPGRARFTDEE